MHGVRREYGPNVARLAIAFLLTSAGMFAASTAFLPSSSSMCLTLLSYGAWFNGDLGLAVLFTAMSAFLSWPFAALVGEFAVFYRDCMDLTLTEPRFNQLEDRQTWFVYSEVLIVPEFPTTVDLVD